MSDYEWFKKAVYDLTKIDLNAYKEKQMKRRIDTLIGKYEAKGYDEFAGMLKKDREVLNTFVNYLTINVSEFFRNPDQWRLMDQQMVPELMGKFGKNLKIWIIILYAVWESLLVCLIKIIYLDGLYLI